MLTEDRDEWRGRSAMNGHQTLPTAVLCRLFSDDGEHRCWIQMILMNQELIRALDFDVRRSKNLCSKVLQVEPNNCLRSRDDSSGQNRSFG